MVIWSGYSDYSNSLALAESTVTSSRVENVDKNSWLVSDRWRISHRWLIEGFTVEVWEKADFSTFLSCDFQVKIEISSNSFTKWGENAISPFQTINMYLRVHVWTAIVFLSAKTMCKVWRNENYFYFISDSKIEIWPPMGYADVAIRVQTAVLGSKKKGLPRTTKSPHFGYPSNSSNTCPKSIHGPGRYFW